MISKKEVFLKEINNEFSIDALYSDNAKFKELYPFCNESGYAEIIKNLQYIEPKCTQKTKVSLLFGESNLLSLLPTLSAISDVIWIADINPAQHEYITFLLDCFKSSDTTEQFLKNYFKNNILLDKNNVYTKEKYTTLEINNQMNHFKSSCGKYYFLNSQSNYDKCKKSLNKVTLLQINLDLSDKDACRQINALLTKHNAVLTYCNFTNIHHYVEADTLQEAVSNLLKDNEHVLIMYSTGSLSKLRVCCTTELKKYLTLGNGNHAYDFDIFLKEFEYNKSIVNSVFGDSELFSKKAKIFFIFF